MNNGGAGARTARAAWKLGTIAMLLGAVFVIRALVSFEPGPLYLVPILLAGLWYGPIAGVAAGFASGGLFAVDEAINPGATTENIPTAILLRLAIFVAAGGLVGWLARSRRELEGRVAATERELAETQTIQATLAPPEPPRRPGLDLATCYLPAVEGVAGDFYLVAEGPDGSTVVAIGDVAGRGIDAAKRAWFVRTVLASSAEFTPDPTQLLELANYSLIEEGGASEKFVTAACLIHQPKERTVRWALAGHDFPVLLDHGSPPAERPRRGLPLGIAPRVGCATGKLEFGPGQGVLLFTDGLTEARPENGNGPPELFGLDRVGAVVSELAGERPETIIDRLRNAAERHAGGHLADDLCLVALRASREPESTQVC